METTAVYFDGLTPTERSASLALTAQGVSISVDGGPAFLWSYAAIRLPQPDAAQKRFIRQQSGANTGEAIVLPTGEFAAELTRRCPSLAGGDNERRRSRLKFLGWTLAFIAAIYALVFHGLPGLASRLAPLVPWSTEVALGNAVEGEVLRQLSAGESRVCSKDTTSAGSKALAALTAKLSAQATLPGKVDIKVIDSPVQNAFAIPGGKIFLMRGLIERAGGSDEVAGVLAHEMGHVANRDAMRGIIHTGGIAAIIGFMMGDFTGAGAIVVGSKYLLNSRYSRSNESEADAFAIDVMTKAGGDVRALARFLQRAASFKGERELELLLTHPVTADRVEQIERRAPAGTPRPLLSSEEWLALQNICKT